MRGQSIAPTDDLQDTRPLELGVAVLAALAVCSPFTGYDMVIIIGGGLVFLVSSLVRPDPAVARSLLMSVGCWAPFLVVCLASALWSELPEATVRGGVMMVAVLAACYRAGSVLSSTSMVRSLATGLRVPLVLSLVMGIAAPGSALVSSEYQSGALQGIFAHRNFLAFAAALLVVMGIARLRAGGRERFAWVDILLGASCLAWAQSQTAAVAMAASIFAVLVVRWGRNLDAVARTALCTVVAGVSVGFAYVVLVNVSGVTQGLGRDTTLTGRTDVWAAVLDEIPRHPYLGAGWAAVWREGLTVSARMWFDAGFEMYHAHNGYLDLVLQVGALGAVCFIGAFLVFSFGALRGVGRPGAWSVSVVAVGGAVLLLVANFTESGFTSISGWACIVILHLAQRSALTGDRSAEDDRVRGA